MTQSIPPLTPTTDGAASAPFKNAILGTAAKLATEEFGLLIQPDQYVGETWDVDYNEITILVHDANRKKAGGIPKGCFLIATRLKPGGTIIEWNDEDTSVILMRVTGQAKLWNASEIAKIRAEAGERATSSAEHWDAEENMDTYTAQAFAYAGMTCRVLGTFYIKKINDKDGGKYALVMGSDIDNYYPNRGLKVYKPTKQALSKIVNFRDPLFDSGQLLADHHVEFGRVRYTSTDRDDRGLDGVRMWLTPTDLLSQKTALFGMTRVGKSNTTKIVAKSVYELRTKEKGAGPRIGQLVFDVNGEYANDNYQDGGEGEKSALRNVWKRGGTEDDVVIYGQVTRPGDLARRITKINFYGSGEMLQVGKSLLDNVLQQEGVKAQYASSFSAVDFEAPAAGDLSAQTRFNRAVLAYHTLLQAAGFELPAGYTASTTGLFGNITDALRMPQDLLDLNALEATTTLTATQQKKVTRLRDLVDTNDLNGDLPKNFKKAGDTFDKANPNWGELRNAFTVLRAFVTKSKTYANWNDKVYVPASSTQSDWHDERLKAILDMFGMGAVRVLKNATVWHAPAATRDYVEEIYEHLENGRLVIVDQSLGDPELNKQMAERVAWRIFKGNSDKFASGIEAVKMHLLVYIEESHNLLPPSEEKNTKNIWSRMAKEGGKFGIGIVYATQEPSSIQTNILKATANWFVGHLNSSDETKEVVKHYDFEDFEQSILEANDRGFMRVRTLSNKFTIPVQIDRFVV